MHTAASARAPAVTRPVPRDRAPRPNLAVHRRRIAAIVGANARLLRLLRHARLVLDAGRPTAGAVDGASLGSLVWGSIERNTGTFARAETAEIEAAFARGDASIHLPGCFNATLHFRRDTLHHYQLTPAVGSKPAGFRSVASHLAGDRVDIFWHAAERLSAPSRRRRSTAGSSSN